MRAAFRFYYFAAYLGFRFCEALIRLLSLDCAFVIGQIAGALSYRIFRHRRSVALDNLQLAFGTEMSKSELRALNRKHFQLLGANLLAGLKTATLPHEKIWERVTADLLQMPEEADRTGWIALISHMGNWEIYSRLTIPYPEYRYGALYQPLANPFIDRHIRDEREKSGITLFDRRNDLLRCVDFLRKGGAVGVLIDQGAGHAGVWTPLFGKLTSSSTLAARLAIRTRLPVLPLAISTSGRARWKLTMSDPVYPTIDDPELLTAKINRLLEEQIRRSPADWLWAHKRWKPLRPHFLFARDQRRVFFPPGTNHKTIEPFRILIVSPESAEETDATFPAVRAIKNGRPDTEITVLALTRLTDVWKASPSMDRFLMWDKEESISSLAAKLRNAAPFEVAIFFSGNWKLSFAVWAAKIPVRVGLRSGVTSWFYNQYPAEPNPRFDPVRMNLHIAQSVGANINEALV